MQRTGGAGSHTRQTDTVSDIFRPFFAFWRRACAVVVHRPGLRPSGRGDLTYCYIELRGGRYRYPRVESLSVRSPLYNSTHLYNLCLVRWVARVRGAHRPFLEDLSKQLVGR